MILQLLVVKFTTSTVSTFLLRSQNFRLETAQRYCIMAANLLSALVSVLPLKDVLLAHWQRLHDLPRFWAKFLTLKFFAIFYVLQPEVLDVAIDRGWFQVSHCFQWDVRGTSAALVVGGYRVSYAWNAIELLLLCGPVLYSFGSGDLCVLHSRAKAAASSGRTREVEAGDLASSRTGLPRMCARDILHAHFGMCSPICDDVERRASRIERARLVDGRICEAESVPQSLPLDRKIDVACPVGVSQLEGP
jgi:hypothetical protein